MSSKILTDNTIIIAEETVYYKKKVGGSGMIQIENLVKRYGNLVAVDHLDLEIRKGEIFGLLVAKWLWKNNHNELYAGTFKI